MTRLLSVNSYHYRRGGSDAVYLDHAGLMEELGWENAFFSMHHPKNYATPWSKYFIDELEFGHRYSTVQKIVMASKVIYSFEAQRKLKRLLDDFKPDIAHLHCIYHHQSPSILSTLSKAGVPAVMTAHDLKIACPAYKMLNETGICERCKDGSVLNVIRHRCVRGSLGASAIVAAESGLHRMLSSYQRHLTRVIVPSRFFMEKFMEWGWPKDKFAYIPNYVDAARFEPQFNPGPYFLYFGRLAPEKGVGTLLRAAAKAGAVLKLAGTGSEDEALRVLNAELGHPGEFLGYQGGAALWNLIRGARAVVLPSEWYENAPMSLLESFALGKTAIGARIGGIPEMIEEGVNGWVFESGNVAELADQLRQVAALPDSQLENMGRAARDLVTTRFSRARYVEATLSLYAELGVRSA
ncbi:MAG: glycosyltransferase family 4 protein [Roseateles sp.]